MADLEEKILVLSLFAGITALAVFIGMGVARMAGLV